MKFRNFLLNLSLFSTILLSSCSSIDVNYEDFEHVTNEDFFSKQKSKYAVYVYSPSCAHCENLKQQVYDYIHSSKNELVPLYLYNYQENESQFLRYEYLINLTEEENIQRCFELSENATKLSQLYLYGTPTIYVLSYNEISEISYLSEEYIGESNAYNYLTSSSVKVPILISVSTAAGVFLAAIGIYLFIKKKKGV